MIALHQQFRVDLPVDEAWTLLTDLPKVAHCLPGASLEDVIDGEYRGGLATKIGPISAKYRGVAVFREHDAVRHRAVIDARGREEKGSGSANALITTQLAADGQGTLVEVSTELAISGRAAQFGRSLLAEVSNSIVDEFVRRLEAMIAGDASGEPVQRDVDEAAPSASGDQSLDVVSMVVLPMVRRAAVPIGAAAVGVLFGLLIGRRSGHTRPSGIPLTYVLPYPGEISNR